MGVLGAWPGLELIGDRYEDLITKLGDTWSCEDGQNEGARFGSRG